MLWQQPTGPGQALAYAPLRLTAACCSVLVLLSLTTNQGPFLLLVHASVSCAGAVYSLLSLKGSQLTCCACASAASL